MKRDELRAWAIRHRWIITLFVAAFALRLHWNLVAHPIGEFMYSDMRGYNTRANAVLSEPFKRAEYTAFFPFGTVWMLAAIKAVFGHENFTIIAIWYALLGAGVVANTYAIAQRVCRTSWLPPLAGAITLVYYPLISIGGYMLSEIPFAFCLTTATLLLLRVCQEGSTRAAWWLGIMTALGTLIRPQLLMSAAVFGIYWLFTRKHYPQIRWTHLGRVALPLAIALGVASTRFYWHTGRLGLVSENGTINQVFGRCHNKGIYARPDGHGHGTIRFAPPPLIQLEAHSAKNRDSWIQLAPTFRDHPEPVAVPGWNIDAYGCTRRTCRLQGGEIEYRGYIGDGAIHRYIAQTCMKRTGLARQTYYSFVHMVQLWAYNSMWPDQADPRPRPSNPMRSWRALSEGWKRAHNVVFAIPALLGILFMFRPRHHAARALVSMNLLALLLVAASYIGGIRFRIPYDPIIIVLALLTYETIALRWLARRRRSSI